MARPRSRIAAALKKQGVAQATAYRWIEAARTARDLALDAETGAYRATSHADSHDENE
jgi:hypothetical protein